MFHHKGPIGWKFLMAGFSLIKTQVDPKAVPTFSNKLVGIKKTLLDIANILINKKINK